MTSHPVSILAVAAIGAHMMCVDTTPYVEDSRMWQQQFDDEVKALGITEPIAFAHANYGGGMCISASYLYVITTSGHVAFVGGRYAAHPGRHDWEIGEARVQQLMKRVQ